MIKAGLGFAIADDLRYECRKEKNGNERGTKPGIVWN